MAGRRVVDPELLRQLNSPAIGAPALPAQRQRVADPATLKRLNDLGVLKDKAAAIRTKAQSPEGRIEQAFAQSNLPEANQPFPLPRGSEYGFRQNMAARLPFGDETAALGNAIGRYAAGKSGLAPETSFSNAWDYGQAISNAAQEKYRREHPWGDVAGTALGAMVGGPTGGAAAFGIRNAPVAARIPATVAGRIQEGVEAGAPLGALYGAGEGNTLEERATNLAKGATLGTAVGAGAPIAAGIGRSARRLRSGYEPDIGGHTQRLEQEADRFYKQVESSGVQLTPNAFNRVLTNLQVRARQAGIDPDLHPAATAAVRSLQRDIADLSRKPTLGRMDQIRRKVRDAAPKTASDDERRILRTMVEGLDDNLNRLTPRDLTSARGAAGVRGAVDTLREARRLQKQFYKAETVDNLIENAKDALGANYTQAGLQTGIRQQFRALNKKIRTNPRERGRWTNEERVLIQKIVRGGKGENVGRWIGKLAVRGPIGVGAYGSGGTAAMVAGLDPVTTAALATAGATAGEAAKRISTARGTMSAERLDRLIGTGSSQLPPPAVRPRGVQTRRLVVPQAVSGSIGGLGDQLLQRFNPWSSGP